MPTHESIIKAYRKYAKNYDFIVNLYRLIGIRIEKYRRLAVDGLELSKGDTVLEFGCGTGLNFSLLEDAIGPTGKIIGVDITDKMLDQARKRIEACGWKNVELVLDDISDYKIPKDVDGIIALGALTYSPEYDAVIKNGYDALKNGKRFVVFDTKKSERTARIFAPILLLFTKPFGVGKDYVKRHPWKSIKKYFEESTYEEGYGGFVYLSVGIKRKEKL